MYLTTYLDPAGVHCSLCGASLTEANVSSCGSEHCPVGRAPRTREVRDAGAVPSLLAIFAFIAVALVLGACIGGR